MHTRKSAHECMYVRMIVCVVLALPYSISMYALLYVLLPLLTPYIHTYIHTRSRKCAPVLHHFGSQVVASSGVVQGGFLLRGGSRATARGLRRSGHPYIHTYIQVKICYNMYVCMYDLYVYPLRVSPWRQVGLPRASWRFDSSLARLSLGGSPCHVRTFAKPVKMNVCMYVCITFSEMRHCNVCMYV